MGLTRKQRMFIDAYLGEARYNATEAARPYCRRARSRPASCRPARSSRCCGRGETGHGRDLPAAAGDRRRGGLADLGMTECGVCGQGGAVELEALSPREIEVVRLVARGSTNKEIAAVMVIEIGTVTSHLVSISGKWGTTNRTQIGMLALGKYADLADVQHHILARENI